MQESGVKLAEIIDTGVIIPAITIWQPWASLIATGRKPVENRRKPYPWRSVIGRTVAIHAGVATRGIEYVGNYGIDNLPFGAVVALVTLVDVVAFDVIQSARCPESYRSLREHEHTEGPWCLIVGDVEKTPVIPATGRQGLWKVDLRKEIARVTEREPVTGTGLLF